MTRPNRRAPHGDRSNLETRSENGEPPVPTPDGNALWGYDARMILAAAICTSFSPSWRQK